MQGVTINTTKRMKDEKGDLVVFLRKSNLSEKHKTFGQIYFVSFNKKSAVRGNHYHKKWHEHFGVITGRVRVVLENIKTKERMELVLSARKNQYTRLSIEPYIAHAIQSLTNSASLLSYTNSEWKDGSDTYPHKLI